MFHSCLKTSWNLSQLHTLLLLIPPLVEIAHAVSIRIFKHSNFGRQIVATTDNSIGEPLSFRESDCLIPGTVSTLPDAQKVDVLGPFSVDLLDDFVLVDVGPVSITIAHDHVDKRLDLSKLLLCDGVLTLGWHGQEVEDVDPRVNILLLLRAPEQLCNRRACVKEECDRIDPALFLLNITLLHISEIGDPDFQVNPLRHLVWYRCDHHPVTVLHEHFHVIYVKDKITEDKVVDTDDLCELNTLLQALEILDVLNHSRRRITVHSDLAIAALLRGRVDHHAEPLTLPD